MPNRIEYMKPAAYLKYAVGLFLHRYLKIPTVGRKYEKSLAISGSRCAYRVKVYYQGGEVGVLTLTPRETVDCESKRGEAEWLIQ
ncbi:hypothetical protein DXC69_16435 [Paenibacillus polymyxa]|nr:hypothetical protein DXC69_16435 [Paenibacillus polymyxa]